MKVQGREVSGPAIEVVVIPREDGELVFQAQAVLDYADFDALCPKPTPPEIIRRGGAKSLDIKDTNYLKALDEWATNRGHWMFLKSLEATEGLEWGTVDMSKPETWRNMDSEFEAAGLTQAETMRISQIVLSVCGLDQEKIDQATERFLAARAARPVEESSPPAAATTL